MENGKLKMISCISQISDKKLTCIKKILYLHKITFLTGCFKLQMMVMPDA